jgi:Putative DNA-binding domain
MSSKRRLIESQADLPAFSTAESEELDWKQTVDPKKPEELAKDMAAMANAEGGAIIVGVSEGKQSQANKIAPLNLETARTIAKAYEQAAKEHIFPPPQLKVSQIEVPPHSNHWIVAVNVEQTQAIFCAIEGPKPESWKIPKRVGSQTKFITPIDAQSRTVDRIRNAVDETLKLIDRWQTRVDSEDRVQQFVSFMKTESTYDIRLPELCEPGEPKGLEYTIRPVRDSEGKPLVDRGEMKERWVVQVMRVANENVMDEADFLPYDASPIREGEYYYCDYYNDSWHLSDGRSPKAYTFHLSGKVGQVEFLESANAFVSRHAPDDESLKSIFKFTLGLDGLPLERSGGCQRYEVLQRDAKFFLRIGDAPLKLIYLTKLVNNSADEVWHLEVESLRGHGNSGVRANIKLSLEAELRNRGIELPKRR